LVTFSIAVTTRQYVGNPIDCVHTRDIPEDVLNTYCWIHSTYTVVDAFMKKQGQEVPFPGVDNSQRSGALTIRHTKYYQWVAFTLFFQVSRIVSGRGMKAFCPHLPHTICPPISHSPIVFFTPVHHRMCCVVGFVLFSLCRCVVYLFAVTHLCCCLISNNMYCTLAHTHTRTQQEKQQTTASAVLHRSDWCFSIVLVWV
uniref:Innexin n=1 Tax=Anopheles coluzzii TaxID=1518534 RepID=A0A8W7PLW5_ANOCL